MLFNKNSFLFPSAGKIILTIILFFLTGWLIWPMFLGSVVVLYDFYPVGFPFPVHATGYCPPDYICIKFSWFGFIVDILFWYLLSSAIVSVSGKVRNKSSRGN